MADFYQDFDLELAWDNQSVTVIDLNSRSRQASFKKASTRYDPGLVATDDNILPLLVDDDAVNGFRPEESLIKAGRQIADLLLPGKIHERFIDFWRRHRRVRLRLYYPDDIAQMTELLKIPWEYAYLAPLAAGSLTPERGFLSLNSDISIAHCLFPRGQGQPLQTTGKTKIDYLSWLGDRRNSEGIFQQALKEAWSGLDPAFQIQLDNLFTQRFSQLKKTIQQFPKTRDIERERFFNDFQNDLGQILNGINFQPFIDIYGTAYKTFKDAQGTADQFGDAFLDFVDELRETIQSIIDDEAIPRDGPRPIEPADIPTALTNCDLIHIISHGSKGLIDVKDDTLTAPEILRLFNQNNNVRSKAIILIACNTGDGPYSVAAALHRSGVPLVIGMTHWVNAEPATDFIDGFYKTFFNPPDNSLERALVAGRNGMYQQGQGGWYVGFGLPRLYLRSANSDLISLESLYPAETLTQCFDDHRQDILREAAELRQKKAPIIDEASMIRNINQIKDWIKNNQGNWYYVSGVSGSGKSTHIAQLIQDLENEELRPYFYHFCTQDCPGSGNRLEFVRSLIVQLRRHFGRAKYDELCRPYTDPRRRFPLLVGNAEDALTDFVIKPLLRARQEPQDGGQPPSLPLIIIDGLDYSPNPDSRILGLLINYRDELDKVARFLITADEDSDPERTHKRILARLTLQDQPELRIDALPMYVQMVTRFEEHGYKLPVELSASPVEVLGDLYGNCLAEILSNKEAQSTHYSKLLRALTLAYEPLERDVVTKIIQSEGWDGLFPQNEIAPYLKVSPSYEGFKQALKSSEVTETEATPQIDSFALYHINIKRYLQGRLLENPAKIANTHEWFVLAYLPPGGWGEITDWASLPRYAQLYLVRHAYESYQNSIVDQANRLERAKTFLELVCNPGFRRLRATTVGLGPALQDIRRGLYVTFAQYALPSEASAAAALSAFDNILATLQASDASNITALEQSLRRDNSGVQALFEFLGLPAEKYLNSLTAVPDVPPPQPAPAQPG